MSEKWQNIEFENFFQKDFKLLMREVEKERRLSNRKMIEKIGLVFFFGIISFILMEYFFDIGKAFLIIIFSVILLSLKIYIDFGKKTNKTIKGTLLSRIVSFIEPGLNLIHDSFLDKDALICSNFIPKDIIFKYKGWDHIFGTTEEISLEFSNIHVFKNKKINNSRNIISSAFGGFLLNINSQRYFEGVTSITPKRFVSDDFEVNEWDNIEEKKLNVVKMGHKIFDRRFKVLSSGRDGVKDIITEKLMDFLIDFSEKYEKGLFITFRGSNIYVGIETQGAFFDYSFWYKIDKKKIREQFESLNSILELVYFLNNETNKI